MNTAALPTDADSTLPDIRHRVRVDAPLAAVRAALLQQDHLRGCWTREAEVADGTGVFRWSGHGFEVRLILRQNTAGDLVRWHCTASNMQHTAAWEGTSMRFRLRALDAITTQIDFSHTGYQASDCRAVCDQGWAFFLGTSLRQYLETGRGMPYPETADTSQGVPSAAASPN